MRLTPSGGIIDVADPSEINASWQGETSMSAEENKAIARRFMEARVEGDWDALVEMLAPDFVSHSKLVPDQPPGREGEKWAMAQLTAALSNRSVLVEDQIAAGDKVASRF